MKPFAASCERNRDPILAVLQDVVARFPRPRVLEIGCGTGQHGVYFAAALPALTWIMSDREENHPGIIAWRDEAALPNVEGPLTLDVNEFPPIEPPVQVVFSANTAHIMSWDEVVHTIGGVGEALVGDGRFLLYGPFRREGRHTSPSNESFDHSLRQMNATMGIRDLEAIDEQARGAGLTLVTAHPMPANNLLVEWRRA